MVEWGSMYDWWTMAERQPPSITASASANPFSTSPRLNVICETLLLGLPSVSSVSTPPPLRLPHPRRDVALRLAAAHIADGRAGEGRVLAHGGDRVQHGRQLLVLHLDQLKRFLGRMRVLRPHGRQRLAVEERLVLREDDVVPVRGVLPVGRQPRGRDHRGG